MALIVQKFGGTSVGTPERIRAVAARVARAHKGGENRLIVVVSAMGHTTDELIALAEQVSPEPPHREMDMLLTAGERISMALLSMALADQGVPAVSFTGSQSGIITDHSHRRARIRRILGDRVRAALAEGKVAIVAGFQGVSESKEITTLGRGGSDTTAVGLAAALKADLCEIYTDVDGVFSADPRIVPAAKRWPRIRHDLMIELAYRGAGVLHPRSVELAREFGVPLSIRNSLNESEGTMVDPTGMEEFRITGVTSDPGKVLITIELARPTVSGAVWDMSAEAHLTVVSPVLMGSKILFFSDREAEGEWRKQLSELVVQGFVSTYTVESKIVPVSVVGTRFSQDGAAIQSVLELLARNHIPVTMGTASALAVTVAVSQDHATDAVKALHDGLVERSQSG